MTTDVPTAEVDLGMIIMSIGTFVWLWVETGNHWVGGGLFLTGLLANIWARHINRKRQKQAREMAAKLVDILKRPAETNTI